MAVGRRKRARREPRFEEAAPRGDLRVAPADRIGGAHDSGARRGARAQAEPSTRPPRKSRRGGNDGGHRKPRRGRLGRLLYWGVVLSLWGVIALIGVTIWIGAHLPAIQSLEVPKRPPSIQITGTDGRILATRGDSGVSATLKELPPYVPQAFIAIEDRRFYSHFGIDPMGIGRAALANILRRGVSQGGSTLTQQLAKNLFLTQERTLTRKMQEAVLALWLERKFSKNEILELYLNRVYFGAGAYGVEAAAQRYFNKHARALSLAEAAMLAGLVKSPSRLAPTRNPDGAERRAQIVLAAMAQEGFISPAQAKLAVAAPAHALKQVGSGSSNYVADWIMDVLDDLVGRVEDDIVVETSIDPALQAAAEASLVEELNAKGAKFGVEQGALVAMSPDGAVRALVGGRNYQDSQFNRAVAAKRQPGSAFKPFVYLTALERGLTPNTVREDRPIALKGWKPENYTREYFGPVTLTQALAMSLNTVSVRLTLEFGPTAVTRTAHRLGIASKLEANPSIALGTSEVSLMEMVAAFAPFANSGLAIVTHVVESVRLKDTKKILYRRIPQSLGQIIEPRYVGMMNAMMQETLLTGTARKAELAGRPAAGKTGTSQDFRDGWFVGYTAQLVAGVWLGNDDSSPTKKMTGGGLPAEIWARFMKAAHRNVPIASLPGLSSGFFSPSPYAAPQAATPPATMTEHRPQAPVRPESGTMDSWLLDRLFGRR
ncbi:MAG: penicillin-binding protein 1A [Pseudorhodoplanes sp.]|jgi:penicillin-binding protein 1A|nr:penicillin-binding protein 1A [Pseudorhodoplanes sp.]